MAATYTGNPGSSPKDTVRFLIQDTEECHFLLQDGEISWVLGQYNNAPMNAAIRCCEILIAKFSRQADETAGPMKIMYSQKSKAFRLLLVELRNRLATEDLQPYAGGISRTDEKINDRNRDRVRPDFAKHMMENQLISPWVTNTMNGYNGYGYGGGDEWG